MTPSLWLAALLFGFCLDIFLGDPQGFPHPVRAIGSLIALLEGILRAIFPKGRGGELVGGTVLVLLVVVLSGGGTWGILWLAHQLSPWLAFLFQVVFCYQLLATKSLRDESLAVYNALRDGTLADGRYAVSRIVGRDTAQLDEEGVVRATVETIAENTADGVVAPLLFLAIGGAPLGMVYKAVNTMDSMVGYQNDRYRYFGRVAARLDDLLNFIPARLGGLLMCLGAGMAGFDARGAFAIFRRDRTNHKSPNSAHTEAACAGALGVELAGNSYYFGQLVEKPTIGTGGRQVEKLDILRAHRLLYATAFLTLVLACGIPLLIFLAPFGG